MDLIVKGGTVVTTADQFKADVVVKNGKIIGLESKAKPKNGSEVVDAKGMYVFPGGIDPHVHLQLPFCGTVSKDDFENGTKAGACGGLTTLIDFAIQTKGQSMKSAVKARKKEADGKVCVDYALHVGITDWKNKRTQNELKDIIASGIPSFKMFMIYASQGWMADDADLYGALLESAKYGGTIGVHAENVYLTDTLTEQYLKDGSWKKYGAYAHFLTRPNFTESEAVQRAITMAEYAKGQLYIVHMSTKESMYAVIEGKQRGVKVIAETCPQYLLLTADKFKDKKTGHYYATCPPIRTREDNADLWWGLGCGAVETMGTDTCTFDTKQKAMWKGKFSQIPFGMPGVETFMPTMYTHGVRKKRLTLQQFVKLTSTNSARLFGLYPKKGVIAVGSDADICVFDPKKEVTLKPKKMQTNCDWSPFDGMKLKGYPHVTISRGEIVAKDGKFVGKVGHGQFVARKAGGTL